MALEEYRKASAKGKRYFRNCVSKGTYPYLQVLDDILENADIISTVDLGVVSIPADQIVGTRTEGRKTAFARNFMPLLGENTEFARKWENLCNAHLQEGIRDPILAYEFLNRFYVQEGNKRVSVLKYFDAVTIPGRVYRLVPRRNDSKPNRIYYEFLDFYQVTGVNYLYFSEPGRFAALLRATGKGTKERWNDDERSMLFSIYQRFKEAYFSKNGQSLSITPGDALLVYLSVYTYAEAQQKSVAEFKADLDKIWVEIVALTEEQAVELSMEPEEKASGKLSILDKLFPTEVLRVKVGFIHEKNAENSAWTYAHEFGRHQLEDTFPKRVETVCYDNVRAGVDGETTIERAISEGCQVIFTTTPKLMEASLKMAVKHPEVKILNCSLNMPHPCIRTYYGRIHEAKFLVGAIAGAMAEDNKIGYVATYNTYGMTAGIKALALGAKNSGLYRVLDDGSYQDLAMPFWHWGEFYVKIVKSILDGNWENEDSSGDAKALNYWWGMSSGVVDVLCSRSLPEGTQRLVTLLRRTICGSNFSVFSDLLLAQGGRVIQETGSMSPEAIIHMDWLADNVVGSIPRLDELIPEAKPLVKLQGVIQEDASASQL